MLSDHHKQVCPIESSTKSQKSQYIARLGIDDYNNCSLDAKVPKKKYMYYYDCSIFAIVENHLFVFVDTFSRIVGYSSSSDTF